MAATLTSTSCDDLIAGAPAITLDQLDAAAELQTRTDRKYVVDEVTLRRLLDETATEYAVLEIGGGRSFGYSSVYFDTADLDLYHAAVRSRRRRFKIRTRVYEDSKRCMLEVKTRDGRGRTVKHRFDYHHEDRARLTDAGRTFITGALVGDGIEPPGFDGLRPTIRTAYVRTTLVDQTSPSRTTIDRRLVCTIEPDGPDSSRSIQLGGIIIETKSDARPSNVDHWLWAQHVRPIKISKSCTGLAALRPDLPSNKWHRTLERHFR